MKYKWWIPLTAVTSVLLLSLCFFPVRLRVAPKLILSRALDTAMEELEERFEDSPGHLISDAIAPGGCQRASVQVETEQPLLGIVRYDMQLHTQLRPSRIQAEGTVVTGGKAVDLSLYLDGDFGAVSSRSLVEGSFYGITYDTFPEDIRSRKLFAALIGEKTIAQWEQSVSELDAALSRDWKLPALGMKDIASGLHGILALEPQVRTVSRPAGASRYAQAVTFRTSVGEITQAAEAYRSEIPSEIMEWLDDLNQDPEAFFQVEFLLSKGELVQVQAKLDSTQESIRATLVLDIDPEENPLNLELIKTEGEDYSSAWMELDTASDEGIYREQLRLTQNRNGVKSTFSLDYGFDLSTGELDLEIRRDKNQVHIQLNLSGDGDTVTIRSRNLRPLLNMLSGKNGESPVICTVAISPGKAVRVPEYLNLDRWSMDDLYGLLNGLGGLLGLQIS